MLKLLIATHNQGKVREYAHILGGLPLRLLSLAEAGVREIVEESGQTYAENAALKAKAYARASGLLTLADDSGLEVDALGGERGVFAARYAGEGAGDEERVRYLLSRLEGVPWGRRTARFICVIVLATPECSLQPFANPALGDSRRGRGEADRNALLVDALSRLARHPHEQGIPQGSAGAGPRGPVRPRLAEAVGSAPRCNHRRRQPPRDGASRRQHLGYLFEEIAIVKPRMDCG